MKSEEESDDNLYELIKRLPIHKAPSDLWDKIDSSLFLEENFGSNIKLPIHKSPESVWKGLVRRLNAQDERIVYKRFFTMAGIAASLLIAATLFIYTYYAGFKQVTNLETYEEEMSIYAPSELIDSPTQEAMDLIREYCTQQSFKCQNPELQQLLSQLDELTNEIKQLEVMFPAYINSEENPELVKMKVKIENTHAEVIKSIIHIIQS